MNLSGWIAGCGFVVTVACASGYDESAQQSAEPEVGELSLAVEEKDPGKGILECSKEQLSRGLRNCDRLPGCETNILHNPNHCGECFNDCNRKHEVGTPQAVCLDGRCVLPPPSVRKKPGDPGKEPKEPRK